jgi:ABC-type Fe3+ transport system substrate-binding protein
MRQIAQAALLVGVVVILGGCGAPTRAPAPSVPATAPTAISESSAAWDALVRDAQREGRVIAAGSSLDPAWRAAVNETFTRRYKVQYEDVSLASGELIARVKREHAAGQQTLDLYVGGPPSGWALMGDGVLQPMPPLLLDPEVTNPEKWRNGQLKLLGPEPYYHLQTAEWVMTDLVVNAKEIEPRQIGTWQDLLKPELRGKIAAFDPRAPGPGQSTAVHLFARFGPAYLEQLYVGQQVQFTKETRQLGEWAARGTYPIVLSLLPAMIERMTAEGFALERVFPADAPGAVTGGNGAVFTFQGGPNPRAAQLFVNWFASKEGQDAWARAIREPSLRKDADLSPVPSYIVPREGVDYRIDHYDYEFFSKTRNEASEVILGILGR